MATKKVKLLTLSMMVAWLGKRFPGLSPSLTVMFTDPASYWTAHAFAHHDRNDPTMFAFNLDEATPLLSFEERTSLLLHGLRDKVLANDFWTREVDDAPAP